MFLSGLRIRCAKFGGCIGPAGRRTTSEEPQCNGRRVPGIREGRVIAAMEAHDGADYTDQGVDIGASRPVLGAWISGQAEGT